MEADIPAYTPSRDSLEYIGPLCGHVCEDCGGCQACCRCGEVVASD